MIDFSITQEEYGEIIREEAREEAREEFLKETTVSAYKRGFSIGSIAYILNLSKEKVMEIIKTEAENEPELNEVNCVRKIVCFHNPDEINGYLSNWFLSDFEKDGIKYSSMEQYMMYQKAILFKDNEIAQQILATSNVGKIKALGRSVKNYDDILWNGMRQIIVYEGLLEKFGQNDKLKSKLILTNNDILAECAVQDKIWGIGLSMKDERRFDVNEWQGQNLLGFSLMKVRDVL